ncbi:hypothetical protein [Halosegnis longus]
MLTFARPASHPSDSLRAGSSVAATILSHLGDRAASPTEVLG